MVLHRSYPLVAHPLCRAVMLALSVCLLVAASFLAHWRDPGSRLPGRMVPGNSDMIQLPLAFEPNAGQAPAAARFVAHAAGGVLFFAPTEVVLALAGSADSGAESAGPRSVAPPGERVAPGQTQDSAAARGVQIRFIGSNPAARITGAGSLPGRVNYLIGNNPANWHSGLPTFGTVVYTSLYPGIDLGYEGTQGQLKGTYTVAPGGDPSQIHWQYAGAHVRVDSQGNLQIAVGDNGVAASSDSTQGSEPGRITALTEQAPTAWQEIAGRRVPVAIHYIMRGDGTLGFALGAYDPTQALTIDPTLVYASYLGGFYQDVATHLTRDAAGNLYLTGTTSSTDFPLAGAPYQPGYAGGDSDIFVAKLSADGATLLYATFLGGNGSDTGQFVWVDAQGDATIGGASTSDNFPTTSGTYQPQFVPNEDVIVTKLNPAGSALVFSTYWGGGVLAAHGFAVDGAGNTYFTGSVQLDFYTWVFAGAVSADGTQQIFDQTLGGDVRGPGDQNADSVGESITIGAGGDIYVTGYTRAADFPVTSGAFRTSIEAYEDGFVTRFKVSDHSPVYSTYLPGNISEYPYGIATDAAGNAYITGWTRSSDYPTTPGAFQRQFGDAEPAFLTKLNPLGTALVYSTFLAGQQLSLTASSTGEAVAVNTAGQAYVAGYTTSPSFPTAHAIQSTLRGEADAFLTKFTADGSGVEFSTYLGGSGTDFALGLLLAEGDTIYLVGGTRSTDFPLVQPYQANNAGDQDGFIMKISEADTTATPTLTGTPPTATPTSCAGGVAPWQPEPPIQVARDYASGAAVGGRFYVIGGENIHLEPPYIAQVERFNPTSGTWDTAAPIPVAASYMAAATLGTKIYLAGGFTARQGFTLDLLQIYDSATDTWSQGARLPVHVRGAAAAAYNGQIYIFGGVDASDSNQVFAYDPSTNTYTAKAPLPIAQHGIGAATIGDRIYVVGGYNYLHYAYDPATDTWRTIALPPTPAYFAFPGVFALQGELWVEGGYDEQNFRGFPPSQEVQIYNPVTDRWRLGPAFGTPRMRSSAAAGLDGRAYVAGGAVLNNNQALLTSVESTGAASCGTPEPTPPGSPSATPRPSQTAPPTATPEQTIPPGPSFTPGRPSATPRSSQTPQTATPAPSTTPMVPTATPTTCTIHFSDVQPADYFYEPVRLLACRGVISGYAGGTFRPYADTTRAQMVKIVVLGFGIPIQTPATPTFSDVPANHPFYAVIETAAARGIVSGYADGTFRPYASVTRGQLSKIVVGAAGWPLLTPPSATFRDVPPGSPFYVFVETAVCQGVVSGYADQTFRPGANATRGQIAKIVALAITQPPGACGGSAPR